MGGTKKRKRLTQDELLARTAALRWHDILCLAVTVQHVALHCQPVLAGHALLAETLLSEGDAGEATANIRCRPTAATLRRYFAGLEKDMLAPNEMLHPATEVLHPTPVPQKRVRRFGVTEPTIVKAVATPNESVAVIDAARSVVPRGISSAPEHGVIPIMNTSTVHALLSILLATDHCQRLSAAHMKILSVEKIASELLWHRYHFRRGELATKHTPRGEMLPSCPPLGMLHSSSNSATSPSTPRSRRSANIKEAHTESVGASNESVAVVDAEYLTTELCNRLPELFSPLLKLRQTEGNLNEVYLLHGTSPESAAIIRTDGFDERVSAVKGGLFGSGIYFTNTICKSHLYSKGSSAPQQPQRRACIIARVLLGEALVTTHAMHDLRRPPTKGVVCALSPSDPNARSHNMKDATMYDSVIGNGKEHKEFVVYERQMVYPEYVIWYTVDP